MASYSLKLDTRFNPFTYAEMLAPVLAATTAHLALEDAYSEMETKASVWENMANEQNDPVAYSMYKKYSDDLAAKADSLMRYGLSGPVSRRDMQEMKSRFSKEIIPIENAYNRRLELAKELRTNPDKTMRYERDASTMSLDDFIANPSIDYGRSYSGAMLTKQVSDMLSLYSKAVTSKGDLLKLGLPFQYYLDVLHGATPELAMMAMYERAQEGDPDAVKFLRRAVDTVMQSSGVLDWADDKTREELYAYAILGIPTAIGEMKTNNYTDSYSMQNALEAEKFRRALEAAESTGRAADGNLPIDIHHLVSPNQAGEKGLQTVNTLISRLGLSSTLDGTKTATINLSTLVTSRGGDIGGSRKLQTVSPVTNKDTKGKVVIFNKDGDLVSREFFIKQGKTESDKKTLGKWYDETWAMLKNNFSGNEKNHYNVKDLSSGMRKIREDAGAITMGALKVDFGKLKNLEILETLIPSLTMGDMTSIYEIDSFDSNGNIKRGKRAAKKDLIDDKGNAKGVPMYYAAGNSYTDGLIMQLNGNTYLIPRDKLGSLGAESAIDINTLLKYNDMKKALIAQYGETAYYNSKEGQMIEGILDNSGAAYLRKTATTLGYTYKAPSFNIQMSNQTEI